MKSILLNSNISNSTTSAESSSIPKVKLLDPKLDAIFQILFSKSNPQVIKGLLSAILFHLYKASSSLAPDGIYAKMKYFLR